MINHHSQLIALITIHYEPSSATIAISPSPHHHMLVVAGLLSINNSRHAVPGRAPRLDSYASWVPRSGSYGSPKIWTPDLLVPKKYGLIMVNWLSGGEPLIN